MDTENQGDVSSEELFSGVQFDPVPIRRKDLLNYKPCQLLTNAKFENMPNPIVLILASQNSPCIRYSLRSLPWSILRFIYISDHQNPPKQNFAFDLKITDLDVGERRPFTNVRGNPSGCSVVIYSTQSCNHFCVFSMPSNPKKPNAFLSPKSKTFKSEIEDVQWCNDEDIVVLLQGSVIQIITFGFNQLHLAANIVLSRLEIKCICVANSSCAYEHYKTKSHLIICSGKDSQHYALNILNKKSISCELHESQRKSYKYLDLLYKAGTKPVSNGSLPITSNESSSDDPKEFTDADSEENSNVHSETISEKLEKASSFSESQEEFQESQEYSASLINDPKSGNINLGDAEENVIDYYNYYNEPNAIGNDFTKVRLTKMAFGNILEEVDIRDLFIISSHPFFVMGFLGSSHQIYVIGQNIPLDWYYNFNFNYESVYSSLLDTVQLPKDKIANWNIIPHKLCKTLLNEIIDLYALNYIYLCISCNQIYLLSFPWLSQLNEYPTSLLSCPILLPSCLQQIHKINLKDNLLTGMALLNKLYLTAVECTFNNNESNPGWDTSEVWTVFNKDLTDLFMKKRSAEMYQNLITQYWSNKEIVQPAPSTKPLNVKEQILIFNQKLNTFADKHCEFRFIDKIDRSMIIDTAIDSLEKTCTKLELLRQFGTDIDILQKNLIESSDCTSLLSDVNRKEQRIMTRHAQIVDRLKQVEKNHEKLKTLFVDLLPSLYDHVLTYNINFLQHNTLLDLEQLKVLCFGRKIL